VVELVHAVRPIQQAFPKVKLVIVGGGRLRRSVERAASGLGSAVEITGYLTSAGRFFELCDIYCHISHQEGLPLALLEAMAHGRPVVASPVGGIPEIIDSTNGILVEGGQALFESVGRLAREPNLRASLGSAARETIREGHTWDARWAAIESIYGLE